MANITDLWFCIICLCGLVVGVCSFLDINLLQIALVVLWNFVDCRCSEIYVSTEMLGEIAEDL